MYYCTNIIISRKSNGEGNGTPLQYSCPENLMDGGAWKAAVHGVAEGWARLSNFTFRLQQYINQELPDVQAGFRKGRGTRDQIANIR